MANGLITDERQKDGKGIKEQHSPRPSVDADTRSADTDVPPGWSYNPSAWSQRVPIIALALFNCALASYLAACEMGIVQKAWDPFFGNGTDLVLNSPISKAFPVPDAALGAGVYFLEALSCVFGGTKRWRTKPWLVLTFGFLVAPLFVVSLTLLMLQPIVVHAWCTFCLLIAAGMLVMVPFALDEVVAAVQFLIRSLREGRPFWKTLWHGEASNSESGSPPAPHASTGSLQGFSVPWNLAVIAALGIWMIVSPVVLQTRGEAAVSAYVTGALLVAIAMLACAEVARPLRFLAAFCGVWLLIFAPWSLTVTSPPTRFNELAVGFAVILCSTLKGKIKEKYDGLDRYLV